MCRGNSAAARLSSGKLCHVAGRLLPTFQRNLLPPVKMRMLPCFRETCYLHHQGKVEATQ
jgi:hypothetical protein